MLTGEVESSGPRPCARRSRSGDPHHRQPEVGIDTKLAGFTTPGGNWNSGHTSSRILCVCCDCARKRPDLHEFMTRDMRARMRASDCDTQWNIRSKCARRERATRCAQRIRERDHTRLCGRNRVPHRRRHVWRPGSELNRRTRLCRPLHNHSATWPVTGRARPADDLQKTKPRRAEVLSIRNLERETRLELATPTLARSCSTN